MDDVDAVQAQIARNMLTSGDWVTARLDGVPYLEKPPLLYWMIAVSYKVFGAHDWAARIPVALSAVGLCWATMAFGTWAFGSRAGFYAGLCISTCIGLFLFTRILLPDAMLTLTILLALWSLLRALDEEEPRPGLWAAGLAASLAVGLLLKSLIGVVFPIGAAALYLLFTRQLFSLRTWRRLRPVTGVATILLIAAPWHILATLHNPPYFSLSMKSAPGEYHGFLWFFFINEQLLRFLNLRYPRDYDTVPRLYFWLFNLAWLFPWSVYLPSAFRLSYRPVDRAGKTRLLALCLIGFVMVFFTFSTTQEYYSMPIYPALALLIGSGMLLDGRLSRSGTRLLTIVFSVAAIGAIAILIVVRHVPTPGDISQALSSNPGAYKLSLGHMQDLTIRSFAYLRLPLALAALAFLIGSAGTLLRERKRAYAVVAVAMVVFFHAARIAMVTFDPYLSSRPLVQTLKQSPEGGLIIDHHYYWYSSVFFYTNRSALLLNGRFNNMVYGSYAPGAPNVFVDDNGFRDLWQKPERYYVFTKGAGVDRLESLVGAKGLTTVRVSGGKTLFTNHPLPAASPSHSPYP
ncbi:Polymyxin resistance protein ArnT [Acidisarcina polymorpha]|uniref:Polymyxin resistance protein ArnT n=2 Tax=Acidisarcina polymorpha TaxID=2211140 RepID=A0A2Z5G2L0_9BACT|nr:Polymyxin resistance protein ArnT [Acidisarcina polymorpha]